MKHIKIKTKMKHNKYTTPAMKTVRVENSQMLMEASAESGQQVTATRGGYTSQEEQVW